MDKVGQYQALAVPCASSDYRFGAGANPQAGLLRLLPGRRDNYIDIISFDEATARSILFVEIPGLEGGYQTHITQQAWPGTIQGSPTPRPAQPIWSHYHRIDDPMRQPLK
jgi:hypothetical protein